MINSDVEYTIEEKEVNGVVQYHIQTANEVKVYDSLLQAKLAIKTLQLGEEFQKHTGMELFIEKD